MRQNQLPSRKASRDSIRHARRSAIALAIAAFLSTNAHAQEAAQTPPPEAEQEQDSEAVKEFDAVIVTGIRGSVYRAQDIKRSADTFVDSVTAEDIGALPDRSVTETLSRIPGVTIDRFLSAGDPEHPSAEGSGVQVRGMTHVRS
jgi:outer membrane cobalamin receptor